MHFRAAPAHILLRWAVQQGLAVIPKSTTPEYMAQNFGCVGWDIDEEDMKRIARMNLNLKFNKPTNVSFHYPLAAKDNTNVF